MSNLNKLKNFYNVQKTITFELKNQWKNRNDENDQVEFIKTQEWVDSLFESSGDQINEKEEGRKILELSAVLTDFSRNFGDKITKKVFDWRGFEVSKFLIESIDRNLYHQKKNKTIKVWEIGSSGKKYSKEYKFSNKNTLLVTAKILGDDGYLIEKKLSDLSDKVNFYLGKVKKDFDIKFGESQNKFSGNAIYYGNIRALVQSLEILIEILNYFESSKYEIKEKNEETKIIQNDLEKVKKIALENKDLLIKIKDFANDNAKKEVELTTLNHRAVNKNPEQIKKQYDEVEKLEKEIETLKSEIESLDGEKFKTTQELENKLKNNLQELQPLNQDIQHIANKKKSGGYNSLSDEEKKLLGQHNFAKKVLKYIKFKGVLVKSKEGFINYGKQNENVNYKSREVDFLTKDRFDKYSVEKSLRVEDVKVIDNSKEEFVKYVNLLCEKKEKSISLGNKKSLYNSISREVLRQKKCNHFSLLCKDDDAENPYFYLILIPNEDKTKMNKIFNEIKKSEGNWDCLDFSRLTFKALEKLALLDSSTFDIQDEDLKNQAKFIWNSYKTKSYNDYKNNRILKDLRGYQREQKKRELEKQELVKIVKYCIACVKKLPDTEKYNFNFKEPEEYKNLEEFAEYIDRAGYFAEWKGVDKNQIKELEKNGEIKVFKLHNKDFRKVKSSGSTHKPNLFTKYWLDAMSSGQNVRILPEIDIFKRPKETDLKKEKRDIICSKTKEKQKEEISKKRLFEDKIYGAFRLEFYPKNEKLNFDQVNNRVEKTFGKENIHFLGLDRGENELVSWCLVDKTGQLLKNGDWTIFEGADYSKKLKQFYRSEKGEKSIINLLAQEFIKKGYCGYLINEINQILAEYPDTYIVLEDLDIKGKTEDGGANKEQAVSGKMGATVYQSIENAIINKFKYRVVKSGAVNGQQTVPNIVRVEDLRIVENVKEDDNKSGKTNVVKSKDQIGNILFVDEYLTSNECPKCEFTHEKVYKHRIFSTFEETDEQFTLSVLEYSYNFNKGFYKEEKTRNLLQGYCDKKNDFDDDETKFNQFFMPRAKKNGFMKHGDKDYFHCPKCGFSSENCNSEKLKNGEFVVKTGDDVAAYNIAKRGLALIKKCNNNS